MEIIDLVASTYKGKKVFVTGHTGFKGAWLVMLLQDLGANVKGYALSPEKDSLYLKIKPHLNIESVENDIRDYNLLLKELKEFEPDYIFHLAAQSLVLKSYDNPIETFEVNVMGTVNVLNACSELKNDCKVVVVTTDKVYEQNESKKPFLETDKFGGFDFYSSSKACCEIVVQSYHRSFFSRGNKLICSARAGNVIGGGDFAENRIIPDLVRARLNNVSVEIRNPSSIRPWQHVLDALFGYLLLGAKLTPTLQTSGIGWNFGPAEKASLKVIDLVDLFFKSIGGGQYEVVESNQQKHEADYLQLDSTMAQDVLGWNPKLSITNAIQWTADWYKHVLFNGNSAYDYSQYQLKQFLSR